jgi:hypothetical protein
MRRTGGQALKDSLAPGSRQGAPEGGSVADRRSGGTRNAERGTIVRFLLASLALCSLGPVQSSRAQDAISTGRAVSPGAAIRVYVVTGSLRVNAWDRDSVAVKGRVDPGAGRFFFGGTRDALKLGVESPEGRDPQGTADLDVWVPADARLWVKSVTADVEVTAGGGMLEVTGVSGRVRVAGTPRETSVETLDGNVELACQGSVARVRTASGTIVVHGVIQDLDASTVSGPLLVGMEGDVARIRLETVSSEIAFKGGLVRDGRLEAETHGGDIELRLPPALGADYHLVSYGNGLRNELVPADQVHQGPQKGEYRIRTGDGRAVVDVRTFKGTVTLKVRGEPPSH